MQHPKGPEDYAWIFAAACVAVAYVAAVFLIAANKMVE